jgi:hypothetical protein
MAMTYEQINKLSYMAFKVGYDGHHHSGDACSWCRVMWKWQSNVFNHTSGDMNSHRLPSLEN